MRRKPFRGVRAEVAVLVLAAGLGLPVTSLAQTDEDANGAVQFNFSTPGARSLGMGGAFLGSVDDATAAYANPAGLLQLSEPEVLVEGRRWRYATPFAERGRISGQVTGLGADTVPSVVLGEAESEIDEISYAAAVFPHTKWAAAIFFHRTASFESLFETGGIFADSQSGPGGFRLFPIRSSYSLDVSHAGLAFAHRWGEVTAGVNVSSYNLELASFTQRFDFDGFERVDLSRAPGVNFQTQAGDDDAIGFSLGLRWDRTDKVSVGMVYRFGPEFDMTLGHSLLSPEVPIPPRRILFADVPVKFNLPDVFGLGISLRPTQVLTVNLDVTEVQYSELIEEMFLFFEQSDDLAVTVEDFVLEDATEVHLGIEYVFTQIPTPVALRLGGWFDPDHRLRAADTAPVSTQARLFAGEDQIHVSAGIGFVLTSHLQLDAAVDLSDTVDTASVSAAVRF